MINRSCQRVLTILARTLQHTPQFSTERGLINAPPENLTSHRSELLHNTWRDVDVTGKVYGL